MNQIVDIADLDCVYLSYDEPRKEETWIKIQNMVPWAQRVDGVKGSDAAHKAAADISSTDRFVLIDGDQFHGYKDKSYTTIVGGDNKYTSIAAASILAKVSRDNLMKSLNETEENKVYGWGSNKGYGTKQHITAIQEVGPSVEHRPSFISHLTTKTESLF
mgnify:CR=1 FL=1